MTQAQGARDKNAPGDRPSRRAGHEDCNRTDRIVPPGGKSPCSDVEAGSCELKLEAGSPKLEAESWELATGNWELGAGNWELEAS